MLYFSNKPNVGLFIFIDVVLSNFKGLLFHFLHQFVYRQRYPVFTERKKIILYETCVFKRDNITVLSQEFILNIVYNKWNQPCVKPLLNRRNSDPCLARMLWIEEMWVFHFISCENTSAMRSQKANTRILPSMEEMQRTSKDVGLLFLMQ